MISDKTQRQLRKVCLTQRENGIYNPKTIPRERQPMAAIFVLVIIVFVFVDYITNTVPASSILSGYLVTFLYLFGAVILHRLILLIKEKQHLVSRYEGKWAVLIMAAFRFPRTLLSTVLMSVIYLVYLITGHGWPWFNYLNFYCLVPVLFFLYKVFDMDSSPINDSFWIQKDHGLDYGSGMAYSFYYGYLHYVIPRTEHHDKKLKELMQDYESKNHVKFDEYRIFILIPKSLICHMSLEEVSTVMEMRNSLEYKVKTVAGVKNRIYKNSVYTIRHKKDGRWSYVCAEYATPLQTFNLVVTNVTPHTEDYRQHKNDILLQFYLTLKHILKINNLDSMCELIYYEDKDETNKFHDVGKIILNRIAELKKQNNIEDLLN